MSSIQDQSEIRALVDAFVEGWNAGDGDRCARPFADDADFTAITGLRAQGREFIARGHSEILATIYRESRLSGTVESVRFLRPDVAVADVTFRLTSAAIPIPERTCCGIVATRDDGGWRIAVFRNMIPFERPMAGPLEESLMQPVRP